MLIAMALASALQCGTLTPAVERTILSVDPMLVRAVVANESSFDSRATSRVGAMGLTQLMPDTARGLNVCNAYDPAQSLIGGAMYLKSMLDRFHGDVRLSVAAYNAGPGAVERYHGVPPYHETQVYVNRVLGSYAAYALKDRQPPEVLTSISGRGSASMSSGPRGTGVPHLRLRPTPLPAFGFAVANPANLAVRVK
jgi:hypothetical protein